MLTCQLGEPLGEANRNPAERIYHQYTENIEKESETLAAFILDPDIYDFLALLQTRAIPVKKIPNILSEFSEISQVLSKLKKA